MKAVFLNRIGESKSNFDFPEITKDTRIYTAENKFKNDETNYYIIYLHFEIDCKYLYVVFMEPLFDGVNNPIENKCAVKKIKELNLELFIQTDNPEATIYNYSVKNEWIEDRIIFHDLLNSIIRLNNYLIREEFFDMFYLMNVDFSEMKPFGCLYR